MRTTLTRRTWMSSTAAVLGTASLAGEESLNSRWRPNYILSSALYGTATLPEILPEVAKTGATSIDLWPQPHGTQREEIESRGVEQVQQLLEKHDVRLGGIACYRPGALNLTLSLPLRDSSAIRRPFWSQWLLATARSLASLLTLRFERFSAN